jgi:hypothetical protein
LDLTNELIHGVKKTIGMICWKKSGSTGQKVDEDIKR